MTLNILPNQFLSFSTNEIIGWVFDSRPEEAISVFVELTPNTNLTETIRLANVNSIKERGKRNEFTISPCILKQQKGSGQ